jgi:aminopeptidase N
VEFSRIALTQQPAFGYGQAWPSLIYLPLFAYLDPTQRYALLQEIDPGLNEFVDEVTAHEVAHQWWGHMVGWSTHHDQWLSEGFADFSAGLYLQLTNKTPEKYLKYYENSRQRILEKNHYGRRANDAGPISLGYRLATEKNPAGYQAVTYNKGGYVLHMLRWMMYDSKEGDKPFIAMMRDFVAQHMNANASTASFQKVVEKHIRPVMNVKGDGKMDWFFQQWVYGTTVPRYRLEQAVTANPDGTFQLKGSISQAEVPEDFKMVVPLYADFDGRPIRLGAVRMSGEITLPFDIQLPKKPRRVLLNANHDVLEQM